jgi:hypothetical protein
LFCFIDAFDEHPDDITSYKYGVVDEDGVDVTHQQTQNAAIRNLLNFLDRKTGESRIEIDNEYIKNLFDSHDLKLVHDNTEDNDIILVPHGNITVVSDYGNSLYYVCFFMFLYLYG